MQRNVIKWNQNQTMEWEKVFQWMNQSNNKKQDFKSWFNLTLTHDSEREIIQVIQVKLWKILPKLFWSFKCDFLSRIKIIHLNCHCDDHNVVAIQRQTKESTQRQTS